MSNYSIRYAVLGSGSKGNAYIIENQYGSILIDNGYNHKTLFNRMQNAGFNVSKLKAIFLTHTHKDHAGYAFSLASELRLELIMHRDTVVKNNPVEIKKIWLISPNKNYSKSELDLYFTPFSTNHDCKYSVGYSLEMSGHRFTIITDTGKTNHIMKTFASQSDVLFLEANYSEQMLLEGDYPDYLKSRILGSKGHLSNRETALFLQDIDQSKLKNIYLCHLSQNNNSIEIARKEISELIPLNEKMIFCPHNEPMPSQTIYNYSNNYFYYHNNNNTSFLL